MEMAQQEPLVKEDIENPAVARAFAAYPPPLRRKLLVLRRLILDTAAATPGVGEIEETLKWGEPAYLTSASKSGSTLRLGPVKSSPSQYALYFNCKTTLVDTFRTLFPVELRFEGNRAIVLDAAEALPRGALAFCITAALTYHRRKS
ncbi:protein of unknown function (DU1801) [Polaromonas sp. JS666]|nr:protein of unknown function (DU1801) [Polaromonas sp. JS666]